jgi:polyhydroxybutyrate depolymerase
MSVSSRKEGINMSRIMRTLCIVILALFLAFLSTNTGYAGPSCKDLTGVPGTFAKTMSSGGLDRSYLLYVPSKYKNSRPTPLIFNFHGLGGEAVGQFGYTQMSALAEKFKFILVTPQGIGNSWNGGNCCGSAAADGIDDVGFVSNMIDEIMSEYCIHPSRIFATGFSNGGIFSNRLACELSDRIAAIGLVAAFDSTYSCDPLRPIPVIAFHGTSDLVIDYSWASFAIGSWIERNGCSNETEIYYQEGDVTCIAYKRCDENATVVFCTIEGGGHNWPGAIDLYALDPEKYFYFGHTTQDIDASRAIWKFFAEHSMPGE